MATFKKRYKRLTSYSPPPMGQRSPLTGDADAPSSLINVTTKLTTTTKSPSKYHQCHTQQHKLLSGLLFFNILTLLIINVTGGQVSHSFASFNSPSLLPVSSSYSSLTSSTFSIAASPPSSSSTNNNNNNHNPFLNSPHARDADSNVELVNIECNSNNILVTLNSHNFNGMIYPKGLSKNSSCMVEYNSVDSVTYVLPLRSCNTMSADVDGGIEYFNTVVVQPHRKLVTNQGRGYHIRCRYVTAGKTISNSPNDSLNVTSFNAPSIGNGSLLGPSGTTSVISSPPMPSCNMKITLASEDESSSKSSNAESVKIGDKLTLTISIDYQDIYGMKVTNCLVRDGLNWGEQPLLNDAGCPVDDEIMGPFVYSQNKTRATVNFQAHKFPYTSSVYYQCNVRLCLKEKGGCEDVPPDCSSDSSANLIGYRRLRRQTNYSENEFDTDSSIATVRPEDAKDLSIEVYSGLYVNEAEDDSSDIDFGSSTASRQRGSTSGLNVKPGSAEEFCISMRKFAIGVAIASLLLMLAVVLLVACILQRRRRRKGSSTASSIYSGPYSNRGYSRD